jgi:hypothetical protein
MARATGMFTGRVTPGWATAGTPLGLWARGWLGPGRRARVRAGGAEGSGLWLVAAARHENWVCPARLGSPWCRRAR